MTSIYIILPYEIGKDHFFKRDPRKTIISMIRNKLYLCPKAGAHKILDILIKMYRSLIRPGLS